MAAGSCLKKRSHLRVALHFLSFALLYSPAGIPWYFGNVNVYVDSYWHALWPGTTVFLSSWVISMYQLGLCVTSVLGGYLMKVSGDQRLVAFLGVALFDSGMLLSYLSVRSSQPLFLLTAGVLTGLGFGFIQTAVLTCIAAIVERRVELSIAFVYNHFNVGAIVFNWVITAYANPDNAQAVVLVGGDFNLFGERSVVDRVPGIFLVLGGVSCACHLTAFVLTVVLHDGEKDDCNEAVDGGEEELAAPREEVTTTGFGEINKLPSSSDSVESKSKSKSTTTPLTERKEICCSFELDVESRNSTGNGTGKQAKGGNSAGTTACDGQYTERMKLRQTSPNESKNKSEPAKKKKSEKGGGGQKKDFIIGDLTPFQMVKTCTFYVLEFNLMANDIAYLVVLNFYKLFGELWIHDDHFVTKISMVFVTAVIANRFLMALVIERIGIKNSQLYVNSSMAVTFFFYCFVPRVSRWLFAAFTFFMAALCSSVYVLMPVMTLQLFGKSHLASNYGVVLSVTFVINLVAPPVVQLVLDAFGWCALFQGNGFINGVALVLSALILPSRRF